MLYEFVKKLKGKQREVGNLRKVIGIVILTFFDNKFVLYITYSSLKMIRDIIIIYNEKCQIGIFTVNEKCS